LPEFLPIFTDFYRFSQQKCQKGKKYYMVKSHGTPKGTYVRGIGKGMKKFIPMPNVTILAPKSYFWAIRAKNPENSVFSTSRRIISATRPNYTI